MATVSRPTLVKEAIRIFQRTSRRRLRGRLHVAFRGEQGVDAGGVTKDLLSTFAERVVDPELGLFETEVCSSPLLSQRSSPHP